MVKLKNRKYPKWRIERKILKKYISGIWDSKTHFNIPIIGVPQKAALGKIFEEIMGKHFINMLKIPHPQIQEIWSVTGRINMNKITLRNSEETRQKKRHMLTFKETKTKMIKKFFVGAGYAARDLSSPTRDQTHARSPNHWATRGFQWRNL